MGVDKVGMYTLEYVFSKFKSITDVCSIGRQEMQINRRFYTNFLKKTSQNEKLKIMKKTTILPKNYGMPSHIVQNKEKIFFENFFSKIYKIKINDSIDATKYENCSIPHDMNIAIKLKQEYDLVFDFGILSIYSILLKQLIIV